MLMLLLLLRILTLSVSHLSQRYNRYHPKCVCVTVLVAYTWQDYVYATNASQGTSSELALWLFVCETVHHQGCAAKEDEAMGAEKSTCAMSARPLYHPTDCPPVGPQVKCARKASEQS